MLQADINPQELIQFLEHAWEQDQQVTLIDVRTPPEIEASGIISTASVLTINMDSVIPLEQLKELLHQSSEHPAVVICRSGARSARVVVCMFSIS